MKENKGITLVALVITIIILLILAVIAIATLGGENGLFAKVKMAKKAHLEAEMKEQLTLALHDLQLEKEGNATLDDVTQEWIKKEINKYSPNLKEDASLEGKLAIMTKNNVTGKFLIDANLNIIDIEYNSDGLEFEYEAKSRNENNIAILIKLRDNVNGVKQIDYPNGKNKVISGNKKDYIAIDYTVELGKEYKFIITTGDDDKVEKTVKIDNYYYSITKTLGDNAKIDNNEIKAAYNKEYNATVIADGDYILTGLTVTMGGETITTSDDNVVDISTGKIKIAKVTGDININVTTKKLEIQVTEPYIGEVSTETDPIKSVKDNSQTRGTPLYINFKTTLEGRECKIALKDDTSSITFPYRITKNCKVTFVVTGIYEGKNIEKEIEIVVNKYKSATGLVKYDAGDWTEEEIQELKDQRLYMINKEKIVNGTFNLNDKDEGLNFTFGGFTYKGDTTNEELIKNGTIVTSRNKSVAPESNAGIPKYEGWQVLESEEKNGKIYVKKLVHAGSSENFTYYAFVNADSDRATYLLSGGEKNKDSNTLSNGTMINARKWDEYKDKELDKKGYIKNVRLFTHQEVNSRMYNSNVYITGGNYWTETGTRGNIWYVSKGENYGVTGEVKGCYGIRPIIEMNEGVYIVSGTGTEADPYVLGKE